MTLPLVAMVTEATVPPTLRALLGDLSEYVHLAVVDSVVAARSRAAIVSDPALIEEAPSQLSLAVWVEDASATDRVLEHPRVRSVIGPTESIVAAAGSLGVAVPNTSRHDDARPVAPAVRARIRRARSLPARAVVVLDGSGATWCGEELPNDAVDTALGCGAVAVVDRDHDDLVRALAWAVPVVTRSATLDTLGAVAGRDAVVAEGDDFVRAATAIMDDDVIASALSWNGRSFYERNFDRRRVARSVCRLLDVDPHGMDGFQARLDDLGAPVNAPAIVRAYDRIAPLTR